MEDITLVTLDHLVLRAKQIYEIAKDFEAMGTDGIIVCSLASEQTAAVPSIHVKLDLLLSLSKLANQSIVVKPRGGDTYPAEGSFTYSSVQFYALFCQAELEAYHDDLQSYADPPRCDVTIAPLLAEVGDG